MSNVDHGHQLQVPSFSLNRKDGLPNLKWVVDKSVPEDLSVSGRIYDWLCPANFRAAQAIIELYA